MVFFHLKLATTKCNFNLYKTQVQRNANRNKKRVWSLSHSALLKQTLWVTFTLLTHKTSGQAKHNSDFYSQTKTWREKYLREGRNQTYNRFLSNVECEVEMFYNMINKQNYVKKTPSMDSQPWKNNSSAEMKRRRCEIWKFPDGKHSKRRKRVKRCWVIKRPWVHVFKGWLTRRTHFSASVWFLLRSWIDAMTDNGHRTLSCFLQQSYCFSRCWQQILSRDEQWIGVASL